MLVSSLAEDHAPRCRARLLVPAGHRTIPADRARVRLPPRGRLDFRDRAADHRGQPGQLPDDRAEGRARAAAVHPALQGHRVLLDGPSEAQGQGQGAAAGWWRNVNGAPCSGCIVMGVAMPWLADTDVGAAYGFARSIVGARTEAELQRRALHALAELVPADVLTWDRVELATGAIDHEAAPAGSEPPGA